MGRELLWYVSQATLARRYDVSRGAVANWVARYPPGDEYHPTPAPDAYVDDRGVWLESSLPAWDAWVERHRAVISPEPAVKDVVTIPDTYLTQAAIARAMNVTPQRVSNWRSRSASTGGPQPPPVDLVFDGRSYWHEDRLSQWEAWREERKAWRATRIFVGVERPRGLRMDTHRERIRAELEQRIRRGIYPPGKPIPSAKALAELFDVDAMTVNRATTQLKEQGLLVRVGTRLIVCESTMEGDA